METNKIQLLNLEAYNTKANPNFPEQEVTRNIASKPQVGMRLPSGRCHGLMVHALERSRLASI